LPSCVTDWPGYLSDRNMGTVAEIEKALKKLPVQDARAVSAWLRDYLDEKFDEQIGRDAAEGRLDKMAEQAQAHYRAGRTKPLDEIIDDA
jgi:hypothetical protein